MKFSSQKNWRVIIIIFLMVIVLVAALFVAYKIFLNNKLKEELKKQGSDRIILTPEEQFLLINQSTSATGKPTLTPKQSKAVIKASTASASSTSSLNNDQKDALIKAMSGN